MLRFALVLALTTLAAFLALVVSTHGANAIAINYNPQAAMNALTYAKAAYCNASNLQNWTCLACPLNPTFKVFNVYQNATDSAQAFSGYDPANQQIVVSWRGSWNKISWEYDFMTTLTPLPSYFDCPGDCKTHQGYLLMYEYLRASLLTDVQKLLSMYPTASILITGHSMGAGLTILTVADFTKMFPKNRVFCVNFGCPRTLNAAASQWFANIVAPGNMVYVTHRHDPIPRTPSRGKFIGPGGYIHTPQEVWFNNDLGPNNYTSLCTNQTATAEDDACIDSVPLWDWNPFDHLMYLGRSTRCNLQEDHAVEKQILTQELMMDETYQAAVKFGQMLSSTKKN